MKSIFGIDSPLMNALSKLADIIIANMMFVILCLPVVTAGASLTALYTVVQGLVYDTDDGIVIRTFWRAFTKNFKQSTLLWLISLAGWGFLAAFYYVSGMMPGAMARVYRVSAFLLALVFLFGYQYFFPLQARYRLKLKHTLKNAWLLSIAALPWTLLTIVVTVGAVYVSFFMNSNAFNTAIYIWAFGGFGLVAYLNSFFFRQAFKKLTPEMTGSTVGQSEGAVFLDEEHRRDDLMLQESTFSNPDWNRRPLPGEEKPKSQKKSRRRR